MRPAAAVAARLGLPVSDYDLLEQALVHSSWLHEHPEAARGHNERLEFLGDAVVSAAISEALFRRHPADDEGLLSARRAAIVSTHGLARLGARIQLGEHLRLGEGESRRGGRARPTLLASAFEALVGALYLDLGFAATRDWLLELASDELDAAAAAPASLKSPKSRLQELTQRRTGTRPEYRLIHAKGPDHEKTFRIEVAVEGEIVGVGEGPSRRSAETAAAARALERLRSTVRSPGVGASGRAASAGVAAPAGAVTPARSQGGTGRSRTAPRASRGEVPGSQASAAARGPVDGSGDRRRAVRRRRSAER